MAIGLNGEVKPSFCEGDEVVVHWIDGRSIPGIVRGKASDHLIDFWIVESTEPWDEGYPYSCAVIGHPMMERVQKPLVPA